MDDIGQYRLIHQRVKELDEAVTLLKADVRALQNDGHGFRADLQRLVLLLIGDDDLNLVGLVDRIRDIEQGSRTRLRWLQIGVSLTGITGLATLALLVLG